MARLVATTRAALPVLVRPVWWATAKQPPMAATVVMSQAALPTHRATRVPVTAVSLATWDGTARSGPALVRPMPTAAQATKPSSPVRVRRTELVLPVVQVLIRTGLTTIPVPPAAAPTMRAVRAIHHAHHGSPAAKVNTASTARRRQMPRVAIAQPIRTSPLPAMLAGWVLVTLA